MLVTDDCSMNELEAWRRVNFAFPLENAIGISQWRRIRNSTAPSLSFEMDHLPETDSKKINGIGGEVQRFKVL